MTSLIGSTFKLLKSSQLTLSFCKIRTFKSSISIDKLYPNSVNITPFVTPTKPDNAFTGYIPVDELDITYSRSSGPGGQHVNVVNTKVDVRFNVEKARWLQPEIKEKLKEQNYTKINKDGYLIVRSEKTRSKLINLADAMQKLRGMIWKTMETKPETPEETAEMWRKRHEKENRIRLMEKKKRSITKAQRQSPVM